MSKLAESLSDLQIKPNKSNRRAACFPLYGEGDAEDKHSVDQLHAKGISWEQIQVTVDDLLKIPEDQKINNRKFVRHWRGECSCWETQR